MSLRYLTHITILLLLVLPMALFAQEQGEICGRVTDSQGQPIDSAFVSLVGTPWNCYTTAQGNFQIVALPPGDYKVRISSSGRVAITETAQVSGRRTAVLEVRLQRLESASPIAMALPQPALLAKPVGTLGGRVVDENGAALDKALVRIVGTDRGGYTNSAGNYCIGYVPAGQWEIWISYAGKEAWRGEVTVVEQQTATVSDVMLVKKQGIHFCCCCLRGYSSGLSRVDEPGTVRRYTGDQINRMP